MRPMQVPTMHTLSRVDYERMARNIVMKQRMRPPKAPRNNLVRRSSRDWYLEDDPQIDFNLAHYPKQEQELARSTLKSIAAMIESMERRIQILRDAFSGQHAEVPFYPIRNAAEAVWDQGVVVARALDVLMDAKEPAES